MNKSIFAATAVAALAVVLAACAMDGGTKLAAGLCSTPRQHCINVLGDNIKVDVDPLYVYGRDHEIFWRLDPVTANGYTFPANGIVFPSSARSPSFQDAARFTAESYFYAQTGTRNPGHTSTPSI
ncbi:MAG TPA: hypothetical protein VGR65_10885 [Casimicrobiaceae bacterium]|jgi:hypothetical protein|nr:hypothetical protein [Casimicrobiaceae bacterium]